MSTLYEADYGTAYYRSNDPIKNLKIKVSLKKVSASFPDDNPTALSTTEGGVELRTLGRGKKDTSNDIQEFVVGWQQKIFCQGLSLSPCDGQGLDSGSGGRIASILLPACPKRQVKEGWSVSVGKSIQLQSVEVKEGWEGICRLMDADTAGKEKKKNQRQQHEETFREVEFYSKPENCQNVLDKKYNQDVSAILNKRRQKNLIFTYVDHDQFSHQQEGVYSMTNYFEKPSPLAVKMAQVRCRRLGGRQLKEKEQGSIPKTLIIDEEPSEEAKLRNHLEAPPIQVMYIMADLSPADRPANEADEYILCALKVDANGVLSVRPDFTSGRKPYNVESFVTRETYDYTIENVSKDMNHQEQEKELRMYREMYTRHNDFLQSCVGQEFELCAVDTLRVVVFGEIVSAQDFEKDNLYIHMFTDLPKNWSADRSQQLSWVTQSCATKTVDQTEIAYFSYPFHFELSYKKNQLLPDSEDELPQFPRLMIEVGALDSWSRHFNEGYSYFQLPTKPGMYTEKAHCWRPIGNSVVDNLRRFFIGGTPEIEDPTYSAVPSTFDGTYLSKFGFRTQSTGTVTARFNIMWQSRSFMESKANKRSLGSLLQSLGITAMQANITSVLEAFKRARMKMVQAREAATQELLREVKPIERGELD